MRAANDADVIVIGAGPAGSSTAYWCAQAGFNVLLLDKAEFPRDKVCGDGLTPRAVGELARMGMDLDPVDGWIRNQGLRVLAGRRTWELPWPEIAAYPGYGSAMARMILDERLARHAVRAGATLVERTKVTAPLMSDNAGHYSSHNAGHNSSHNAGHNSSHNASHNASASTGHHADDTAKNGRVVGVVAQSADGRTLTYRAPIVVAADGVSSRFATSLGIARRDDRPLGTAYRTYFHSANTPRHEDAWMESHLELWSGEPEKSQLMPGYGWIFALGDGRVNVGLGSVSSTPARQSRAGHDYKALLGTWIANAPREWNWNPDNQLGPIRGAALPMGFNRSPLYRAGVLLAGDAAGMVSPFNGEGIAYALQAGRVAAEVIDRARTRATDAAREAALAGYSERMRAELGGYYTLGRAFVRLIEHPAIMRFGTRYALPVPAVMRFVTKLLSDAYEPHGGDWVDRTIAAMARLAPAA